MELAFETVRYARGTFATERNVKSTAFPVFNSSVPIARANVKNARNCSVLDVSIARKTASVRTVIKRRRRRERRR